ncbi:MAG: glycosyltransferase family 2 protein [Cryomorphaceae bacterium]|nr:glycosyltransferase [Flavobacteriales bacterium]
MKKVCVGITTKNRASVVGKAIDSALNQSYDNKEVIVFNDGSTDGTKDLENHFPKVKWIHSEKSIGIVNARNTLMNSTDADYFVSLDDDAWFLEGDEIEIGVKYMESDPNLGCICYDILQNKTLRFRKVDRTEPIESNIFVGCGYMHLLKAVRDVGSYIQFPLPYGHEEKDLSIRMLDAGYRILFLPGVHVWHEHTGMERNAMEQARSFLINDLIFQFRRVPLIYLLPVLVNSMIRKLKRKRHDDISVVRVIFSFIKFIPSQFKYVKRIRRSSYIRYRKLSKSYLGYLYKNAQK